MNSKIKIIEKPELHLACVEYMGTENLENAFDKIFRWAKAQNLLNEGTQMMTIYHDSFSRKAPDRASMSACMVLNHSNLKGYNKDLIRKRIKEGRYIVGEFEIMKQEFEKSWIVLFEWMNENGYKKADKDLLEIYHSDPNKHPDNKVLVELCIPII